MTFTQRREKFRAILAGDKCIHPASVFDPMSVRMAEAIGYEVAMLAGSVAALTILGSPDICLITLSEFAEQCRRICRAAGLPLFIDADHGYGNALSVMRTVEETEAAGVSCLTIEDTLLPRAYGPSDKMQLLSMEEGIGKMKAAVAARLDKSYVVVARTSAIQVNGLEDAIRRAKAYQQCGVDGLFFTGVKDLAMLDALRAELKLPLLLGNAEKPIGDRETMAARGVRVMLQGHTPQRAGVKAVYDAMKALRDAADPSEIVVASNAIVGQAIRQADYAQWTKDYLGGTP